MLTQQDRLLDQVGDDEPVYRWTTALNGFAVHLTTLEAGRLAAQPQVRLVERDTVRPVTGTRQPGSRVRPSSACRPARAAAGTVIGFVDTGVHPQSPVFAYRSGLGPRPRGFRGSCEPVGTLGPLRLQRQDHRRPLLRRRVRGRPPALRRRHLAVRRRRARHPARVAGGRQRRRQRPRRRPEPRHLLGVPRPRRGWRSTRPAGPRPTPTTTAARAPTWSRPWTRRWPTGSTYSMSPSPAPPRSTPSTWRCSARPSGTCSSRRRPATTAPGPGTRSPGSPPSAGPPARGAPAP